MLLHAQLLRQPLQAQAVALALVCQQMRMRGPQDDVHHLRVPLDDRRQRLDRVLDAFAGPD